MPLPCTLHSWKTRLCLLFITCLLQACAGDPRQHAQEMAQPAGLIREQVQAERFLLTSYVRITRTDQPLNIYIEGDGLAWATRYQPSDDPTPRRALGLALAVRDPAPNVVYLARPCQFTPMAQNPACSVDYWTGKRFAPEVIAAMDEAVTHYAKRTLGQPLNLVGYSGGGAVAVLVAARRQDVASLRTVAGNLDHDAVNRLHHVTLMPASLNPIDVAAQVAAIPQLHFSGSDDSVVPTSVARDFTRRVGITGRCARVVPVDGLSHEGDWASAWPRLLATPLPCTAR